MLDDDPDSPTYNGDWDSSLCQAGQVIRVEDVYTNLDDRTLEGTDYAVEYSVDTDFGTFTAKFMSVQFDKFEQEASGISAELIAATAPGGILEGSNAPSGYGDLLGVYDRRAYYEQKDSMRLSWKKGRWDAFLSGTKIGSFQEKAVTDNAKSVDVSGSANDIYACSGTNSYSGGTCGDTWTVDAMMTLNLTVGYKFKNGLRLRGTVRNLQDTRAPLADEYTWGFVSDVHSDYGKSYSLELYKKF